MSELAVELRLIGRAINHEEYVDAGVVPLTLAHAADRIEALEAAHEQDLALIKEDTAAIGLAIARIAALEAALRKIADDIHRDRHTAIARAALAPSIERDQTP